MHVSLGRWSVSVLVAGTLCASACGEGTGESAPSEAASAEAAKGEQGAKIRGAERAAWRATCAERLVVAFADRVAPLPPPLPLISAGDAEELLAEATLPLDPPSSKAGKEEPMRLPYRRDMLQELDDRLALNLEEGCPAHALEERFAEHPQEEALACAVAYAYDRCGEPEKAERWVARRVEAFPESAGAQVAATFWQLTKVLGPPGSPFPSELLSQEESLAIIEGVLADLEKHRAAEPDRGLSSALHLIAARAYSTQSMVFKGEFSPKSPEELLLHALTVDASAKAWQHLSSFGELRGRKPCPTL